MGERAGISPMRVVPVNTAVAQPGSLVTPFEIAEEMIDRTEFQSLAHCPCRMSRRMAYEGCDYPLEVCLHFGWVARFQIEQGLAKKISKKEAVELLHFSEEQGLVHLADNHSGELSSICNCCPCCCMFIQGYTEFEFPHALTRANYWMEIDQETCKRCGVCAERCPVEAIAYTKKEVPVVDVDRCIGCGVCRPTCPTEAAQLVRKVEEQVVPLRASREAGQIMLRSRGRI
jgi:NAD-dependent dihydropyrimidine dehydrogenase PreA subunit